MNRGLKLLFTLLLFAEAVAAGQLLRIIVFPFIQGFGRDNPGLGAAIVTVIAVVPVVLVSFLTRAWRKDLRILLQPDYWSSLLESGVNRVRALLASGAAANSGQAADRAKDEAKSKAHNAYQESLGQLKLNPSDPDLRQKTLRLGREYSNLTKDKKGVAVVDEVTLLNDINAACGSLGGHVPSSALQATAPAPLAIEDRLERLESLKRKGLISESEYQSKRSKLLEEI